MNFLIKFCMKSKFYLTKIILVSLYCYNINHIFILSQHVGISISLKKLMNEYMLLNKNENSGQTYNHFISNYK